MPVNQIPRSAVHLGIAATRLPLTAAEAVLGHRDDEAWPPALAFDAAAAQVTSVFATVLHDETLAEEGRLIAAKVAKLRQATELDALAEERRQEADDELAAARRQADQKRRAAQADADRRKAQAEQRAQAAERKAEQSAARKEALAQQAVDAAAAAVERTSRTKRARTVAKTQAALDKEKAALARKRKAKAADKAIDASKRARTSR